MFSDQNDYWAPNDSQQNEAVDTGHYVLQPLLGGGLFLAPIDDRTVRVVLDLGCGTRRWTIEYADAHKHAQVVGVDLSPIQDNIPPRNCEFVVDDIEDDSEYSDDQIDVVHIRCLVGPIEDWPALYRQAYQFTKPGGWIQHMDMSINFRSHDGSIDDKPVMRQWSQLFIDSEDRIGKIFLVVDRTSRWTHEADFENVEEKRFKAQIGSWY